MSDRYVIHQVFALHARGLTGAWRDKKSIAVQKKYFPERGNPSSVPVALRWVTTPHLGFPREPFQVFRRPRQSTDIQYGNLVGKDPQTIGGMKILEFPTITDFLFLVRCAVTVFEGETVTLTALDITGTAIPGQYITMKKSGGSFAEFRCPGIKKVRVVVSGGTDPRSTVGPVWVIGQNTYANLTDWTRIEVVGLPLKDDEAKTSYRTLRQGFEAPLLDGFTAAVQRVNIAAALQLDPPPTGLPDFPGCDWPLPRGTAYVLNLRGAESPMANSRKNSLVGSIRNCLMNTDDTRPDTLQADYEEEMEFEGGIRQVNAGSPDPELGERTKVSLPVTAFTLIAAATDPYAATALGYGSTDIPPEAPKPPKPVPITSPTVDAGIAFDYLVTAPLVIPPGWSFTLAALSAGYPMVTKPLGLSAANERIYPPVPPAGVPGFLRNQPKTAAIRLSWHPPALSQGYGVLVSRAPGQAEILNSPRPRNVGGYDPFLGVTPAVPDPAPDQQTPNYWDYNVNIPIQPPSATNPATIIRYLVAGMDVFGIWSDWAEAQITLTPDDSRARPGLGDVKFLLSPPGDGSHRVPASIEINFSWDWQDRSPDRIRFTSCFIDPSAPEAPEHVDGFMLENGGSAGSPVILMFTYGSEQSRNTDAPDNFKPEIVSGHTGNVEIIPPAASDPAGLQDQNIVHYRLTLTGLLLDFSAVNRIDLKIWANGCESLHPGEWSEGYDATLGYNPRAVHVFDPVKPSVDFKPADVCWTALPDARGIARGILTWDPVEPAGKGTRYYIWEATESAFIDIPPPDQNIIPMSIRDRATQLRDTIANNPDMSLQNFSRLNGEPLEETRTEVLLPAAASILYAYRISAVSGTSAVNGVTKESPLSDNVAIFAVPHRNTPSPPRLILRRSIQKIQFQGNFLTQDNKSVQTGIDVIISPAEKVIKESNGTIIHPPGYPDRYRLFRVRSPGLAGIPPEGEPVPLPSMGPPKYTIPEDFEATEHVIHDADIHPSWYPYYYRATALGHDDPGNGEYGGESGYSPVQAGYFLPQGPPMLDGVSLTHISLTAYRLELKTNLPVVQRDLPLWQNPPDLSSARVEILHIERDPAERFVVNPVSDCRWNPYSIPVDGSMTGPVVVSRTKPDASEQWILYVVLPSAMVECGDYLLRLTDPFGRMSEYLIREG